MASIHDWAVMEAAESKQFLLLTGSFVSMFLLLSNLAMFWERDIFSWYF